MLSAFKQEKKLQNHTTSCDNSLLIIFHHYANARGGSNASETQMTDLNKKKMEKTRLRE